MQRTLILACCAGVVVLALEGGGPAQATPAVPAVYTGESSGDVITVGPKYRYAPRQYHSRHYAYRPWPHHGPFGPKYRYAPRQYYYRHYPYLPYYYRPYYRPY